jgi:uncharacterized membrane protein YeaQ/YmgE (transglycosylase-associated protein family)
MESLIVQLIGGAVGGNIAGGLLKNFNLGTLWNSVVGVIGGGLGGQLLSSMGFAAGSGGSALDIGNLVSNVASSGVGGAVLLLIVGVIKKAVAK